MSKRIIIACILWISVLTAVVMAGCSGEGGPDAQRLLEGGALRVRLDSERDRIWLLDLDGVRVYDAGRKRVIRRISLPNWTLPK